MYAMKYYSDEDETLLKNIFNTLIVNGAAYKGDKFPEIAKTAREARNLLLGKTKIRELEGRSKEDITEIKNSILNFSDSEKAKEYIYKLDIIIPDSRQLDSLVPTLLYEAGIISSNIDCELLEKYSQEKGRFNSPKEVKAINDFFDKNPQYQPENFIKDVLLDQNGFKEFNDKISTSIRPNNNIKLAFENLKSIIERQSNELMPKNDKVETYNNLFKDVLNTSRMSVGATMIQRRIRGNLGRAKASQLKMDKEDQIKGDDSWAKKVSDEKIKTPPTKGRD